VTSARHRRGWPAWSGISNACSKIWLTPFRSCGRWSTVVQEGRSVCRCRVAAVSVGIIDGEARLDLDYEEDVRAEVDMNVVMSSEGKFVEVQGTGEHGTFDRAQLDELVELAIAGIHLLDAAQTTALAEPLPE